MIPQGPMNELAADDLFSLEAWAKNILGLAIVVGLLCLTIGLICWSLKKYLKSLSIAPRRIDPDNQQTTYAKKLDEVVHTQAGLINKVPTTSDTNQNDFKFF
jgi:hypothetical protein